MGNTLSRTAVAAPEQKAAARQKPREPSAPVSLCVPRSLEAILTLFLPSRQLEPKLKATAVALKALSRLNEDQKKERFTFMVEGGLEGGSKIGIILYLPSGLAERLPQEQSLSKEDHEGLELQVSFDVNLLGDGRSAVKPRPVITTDSRKDPAEIENCPEVLLAVLEACGFREAVEVRTILQDMRKPPASKSGLYGSRRSQEKEPEEKPSPEATGVFTVKGRVPVSKNKSAKVVAENASKAPEEPKKQDGPRYPDPLEGIQRRLSALGLEVEVK